MKEHDFYYVHKPFRNKKNILLWLYCFFMGHHVTVKGQARDAHVQCTTCGKWAWLGHPSVWELDWFITHEAG